MTALQPSVFPQFLYVTQAIDPPPPQQLPPGAPPPRSRSTTFLQMRLIPEESQLVRLDLAIEQEIRLIVLKAYPELADNLHDPSPHLGASLSEFRLRDWFQITYRETLRDYEMGWAINSR